MASPMNPSRSTIGWVLFRIGIISFGIAFPIHSDWGWVTKLAWVLDISFLVFTPLGIYLMTRPGK